MLNRLFEILGFVHNSGVLHGAILPQHLLIQPATHGLILIDWCFSSRAPADKPLRSIVASHRDWYPPEVLTKETACPGTDLWMVGMCGLYLLGANPPDTEVMPEAPDRMASFLRSCLIPSPAYRPQFAWELRDAWGELLEDLFGAPQFVPFEMPPTAAGGA